MLIPEELAALASERRIIPFLGAGFSDSLGLPSWEKMLRGLCDRVEGALPFDQLSQATEGNYLQMAEYLYLKSDKRIGPLRRHIDRNLVPKGPLAESGPHVELINLGAQQIYTTNYDDLVETAYRDHGYPVDVVTLPKDIALADPKRTQVVKYHGDLEHEETLVLTESSYYRRLDFDSPMDLKFRSDLLGKAVLFMGYSFRDVNIRVLWFKLMDMMRDIPEADRRPSYIVRLDANPVLEDLYAAVGIRTVVLSPDKPVTDSAERGELLAEFLLELSMQGLTKPVSAEDAHASSDVFVSSALLKDPVPMPSRVGAGPSPDLLWRYGGYLSIQDARVSRLLHGRVSDALKERRALAVAEAMPYLDLQRIDDLVEVVDASASSANLTATIVRVLASQGGNPPRKMRLDMINRISDWSKVWAAQLPDAYAQYVNDALEAELSYQAFQGADEDAAYLADLGARLANGTLTSNAQVALSAADILKAGEEIYPAIADLSPSVDGPPDVAGVLKQIYERQQKFVPVDWTYAKRHKLPMLRGSIGPARRTSAPSQESDANHASEGRGSARSSKRTPTRRAGESSRDGRGEPRA